jgi:hypothetical protein
MPRRKPRPRPPTCSFFPRTRDSFQSQGIGLHSWDRTPHREEGI